MFRPLTAAVAVALLLLGPAVTARADTETRYLPACGTPDGAGVYRKPCLWDTTAPDRGPGVGDGRPYVVLDDLTTRYLPSTPCSTGATPCGATRNPDPALHYWLLPDGSTVRPYAPTAAR